MANPSPASRAQQAQQQRTQKSSLGKLGFTLSLLLVLAIMTAAAIGGMRVMVVGNTELLSAVLPEDGRGATVVGGLAFGALAGMLVPVILLSVVKPDAHGDRVSLQQGAWRLLGVACITIYLAAVSVLVAQLGWLLPENVTTALAVPLIGLSWLPAAVLASSDRFKASGLGRLLPKSRKTG
ncbi:hypothetical protein [Streptomyces sp. 8N616]|uniref:hypothetical protein n=1 Tax=Streptomyces sp. 8N616 TaxID=3457414 RepID=UPI003FD5BEEE